jgi:hypothetical protein
VAADVLRLMAADVLRLMAADVLRLMAADVLRLMATDVARLMAAEAMPLEVLVLRLVRLLDVRALYGLVALVRHRVPPFAVDASMAVHPPDARVG